MTFLRKRITSKGTGRVSPRRGQVMILTVLTLGGTILMLTAVSGLLVLYQIRQSTDLSNSGKAIFAADTGLERGLYQFFQPTSTAPQPVMSNGSSFSLSCQDGSGSPLDCADEDVASIRSIGSAGGAKRAFQMNF